jgi:hypothetical protein
MLQTRIEESKFDGDNITPKRIIIEVPLTFEMIQDCYMYYAMDAPTEIKRMVMEVLGETIDELILSKRPTYVDENWLKYKLKQVKITIEEQK